MEEITLRREVEVLTPQTFGDIWCLFVSFGPTPHIYQRGERVGEPVCTIHGHYPDYLPTPTSDGPTATGTARAVHRGIVCEHMHGLDATLRKLAGKRKYARRLGTQLRALRKYAHNAELCRVKTLRAA